MIVLCTGIIRSGSTWSFNVARLLLEKRATSFRSEFNNKIRDAVRGAADRYDNHVIKAHEPDRFGRRLIKDGRCRTICSFRDPLDCIASGIEAFGGNFKDMVSMTRRHMKLLKLQIVAGGVHFVWYDDIVERPRECIAAIAAYLDQELADDEGGQIAAALSRESVSRLIQDIAAAPTPDAAPGTWDRETLFHPGHIRDKPKTPAELLTADQMRYASARLDAFVDRTGALRDEFKALGRL